MGNITLYFYSADEGGHALKWKYVKTTKEINDSNDDIEPNRDVARTKLVQLSHKFSLNYFPLSFFYILLF